MKKIFVVIGIIIVSITLLYIIRANSTKDEYDLPVNLKVSSTSFGNDGDIPKKYTGKGDNISPPLKLDTTLNLDKDAGKSEPLKAMKEH